MSSFNTTTGYSEDYKESFLIQINEDQRKFIAAALEFFTSTDVGDLLVDEDGNIKDDVNMLQGLFDDLPTHENTFINPKGKRDLIIHGFCL